MTDAKRDNNYVTTLIGVSSSDGITPVTIYVDPVTHRVLVQSTGSGGSLATLTDVTLTSVAQGDILYYNGTKWVNLPAGTSGWFLQTAGAGANPAWAAASAGGANTALSNLAAVAVNLSLIPGAAGTLDLGSLALPWRNIFLAGASGTPATNHFEITGTSTGGLRTITLPDVSGTVVTSGDTGTVTNTMLAGSIAFSKLIATDIVTVGALTSGSIGTGFVVKGVTMTLGSDASFDTYYRGATGVLTRLAAGTAWQFFMGNTSAAPSWVSGPSAGIMVSTGSGFGSSLTAPSGTIVGTSDTQTLTNKRNTKRVSALSANSATPAINTDTTDVVHITAQTTAITSFTSSLTGTPVDGDTLRISVTGTGAIGLTFGTSFEAGAAALPTTTVTTARLDMIFYWNTETSKWRCMAAG